MNKVNFSCKRQEFLRPKNNSETQLEGNTNFVVPYVKPNETLEQLVDWLLNTFETKWKPDKDCLFNVC